MKLIDVVIDSGASVIEAMIKINEICEPLLVLVDSNFKLNGVITDGDIRRYLINGGSINDTVINAANTNFKYANINHSKEDMVGFLKEQDGISKLPIVDETNTLVGLYGSEIEDYIPIYDLDLSGNEQKYVIDAVNSTFISSVGKYIDLFESSFSKYTGLLNSTTVSNGTVALELAMACIPLGKDDHIVLPDVTFVSPINAAIRTGASISLIDCDSERPVPSVQSYLNAIEENTKAVVVVHLYGYPFDVKELRDLLPDEIFIIEDCAEAFGSYYHNLHVGHFSDFATFSFFGNKTISTGEGGMIYCRDHEKFLLAKLLKNHGMSKSKRYWHEEIGYNFRMTNLQAAVGYGQIEKVESILSRKQSIFKSYYRRLSNYGFHFFADPKYGKNSQWLVVVSHPAIVKISVDELINRLKKLGIDSRPFFYPISLMEKYEKYRAYSTRNGSLIQESSVCLPSYPGITESQILRICENLISILIN